jgi:hypothetical protein
MHRVVTTARVSDDQREYDGAPIHAQPRCRNEARATLPVPDADLLTRTHQGSAPSGKDQEPDASSMSRAPASRRVANTSLGC